MEREVRDAPGRIALFDGVALDDVSAEAHNARVAADAGVNPEVLFFDARDGTMVTRYVDGSMTMTAQRFEDRGAVARAARAFRRLRGHREAFESQFELFEQIDQYLDVVRKLDAPIPEGYADVQREAEAVREALGRYALPSAPCHCDPLVENYQDTGER